MHMFLFRLYIYITCLILILALILTVSISCFLYGGHSYLVMTPKYKGYNAGNFILEYCYSCSILLLIVFLLLCYIYILNYIIAVYTKGCTWYIGHVKLNSVWFQTCTESFEV